MSEKERRSFGTLYKRPDSPFWWIRYSVGSKRHHESSRSRSKGKAEELLARRQVELGMGRRPEPEVRRTTFEDLAKLIESDYVVNRRKSLRRLAGLKAPKNLP